MESLSVTGGRWLTQARIEAGFTHKKRLAERMGAPEHDIWNWENSVSTPNWRRIEPLSVALGVPVNDVLGALWGEMIGDPCQCGCGGQLVTPLKPGAAQLLTSLKCERCSAVRTYGRGGKHRRLCEACKNRVDRIRLTCVGYEDHGVTVHAYSCRGTVDMRPGTIEAKRQWQKRTLDQSPNTRLSRTRQHWFVDEASGTFRCGRCSTGSMMIVRLEDRVKGVTSERITSRTHRSKLIKDNAEYLGFVSVRPGRPKGFHFSAEHSRALSKSQIVTAWRPGGRRSNTVVGTCELCGKLTLGNVRQGKDPTRTHGACFYEWMKSQAGKRWLSTGIDRKHYLQERGSPGALAPRGRGRPENRENVTRHFSWAILHYLGGESIRAIAKDASVTHPTVSEAVAKIIERLPSPEIVPAKWRLHVELLSAALAC